MPSPTPTVSLGELFAGFCSIGLSGFGGVLPWARRMMVDQRGWLTDEEFTVMLGLCSTLPGPNIVNVAAALGARLRGVAGALAAVAGLLLPPLALVLTLLGAYERFGSHPAVQGAFRGVAAIAAGLILAAGIKLAARLRHARRPWMEGTLALVAFVAVAIFRWPLGWVLLVLAPLSLATTLIAKPPSA